MKTEPWPGSLSISSAPRWWLTMCLTMARPSPVPPSSRERAGVDAVEALGQPRQMLARDARRRGRAPRARPRRCAGPGAGGRQEPGGAAAATSTAVPGAPYLIALSIRFWNTWASSSASPCTGGRSARQLERDPHAARRGALLERVGDAPARTFARSTAPVGGAVLVHLDARQRQQILDQPRACAPPARP